MAGNMDFIDDLKQRDRELNSFIVWDLGGVALEDRAKGGKLADLRVGVKSNISVDGLLVSAASKTLENHMGSYDAFVVKRIKREGGSIVGMTNMDEFACGSSGETSFFGATGNPS
ncbi:MAG: amidase family protein, partial [Candidatus Altiarchaeota archaeon]|nr:amidase family protein [Candidatus Altiarchaeota archaeon]